MTSVTLTGKDTITIYDRVLSDMADGDVCVITFPNDLVKLKTGKNRNSIFAYDATGENADFELRVIRGSSDDRFLQAKLAATTQDFPSVVLGGAEFCKRLGDGVGNVFRDVYTATALIPSKNVEVKENVEGETGQAVSVYKFKAATAVRSIQ